MPTALIIPGYLARAHCSEHSEYLICVQHCDRERQAEPGPTEGVLLLVEVPTVAHGLNAGSQGGGMPLSLQTLRVSSLLPQPSTIGHRIPPERRNKPEGKGALDSQETHLGAARMSEGQPYQLDGSQMGQHYS